MALVRSDFNNATQGLTDKQRDFARAVANGNTFSRAAELAGYAPPHNVIGSKLAADPKIVQAVELELERKLRIVVMPRAVAAIDRNLGPDAPPATQIRASEAAGRIYRDVVDRIQPNEPDALSAAELEATIARLKEHAAALDAKQPAMIDVTPEQRSGGLFD